MSSFKKVDDLSGTDGGDVTWTAPTQQVTILEGTNPRYPRLIQLSNNGVKVIHGTDGVGFEIADLIAVAVSITPGLTWPPIITVQPVPLTKHDYESATFTITATSEITVTYQWQHSTNGGSTYSDLSNAGVFSGVTTDTLAISDCSDLNNHLYRCVASNDSGDTNSTGAKLTVITSAPTIIDQPIDESITNPGSGAFSLDATGTGNTYAWQISEDGGSTWNPLSNGPYNGVSFSGATTDHLNMASTTTALNGSKYKCVVTNGSGSVTSNVVTLTIT